MNGSTLSGREHQRRQRQRSAATFQGRFIAALAGQPRHVQVVGRQLALDLGRHGGGDFHGIGSLARRVPYSRRQVDRAWRELRERGFISYRRVWRRSYRYGLRSYIRELRLWTPAGAGGRYATMANLENPSKDSSSYAVGGAADLRASATPPTGGKREKPFIEDGAELRDAPRPPRNPRPRQVWELER